MISIISENYVRERVEKARFYQFCQQADRARMVLSSVINHLAENISCLSPQLSCEVLVVYGGIISYLGMSGAVEFSQESAMNYLTEAQTLAADSHDADLLAEIDKQIALAYWRGGQHENAIAYFDSAIDRITPDIRPTNLSYLSARTDLIAVYCNLNRIEEAKFIIEEIAPLVALHSDKWLKTIFYTEAAGVFLRTGETSAAETFLVEAIALARQSKNKSLQASALNNLALVRLERGENKTALVLVEEAMKISDAAVAKFTFAMFLETKARILLAENKAAEAFSVIITSIKLLEQSENHVALAEALWTRIEIFTKLGNQLAAFEAFAQLCIFLRERLNEGYQKEYISRFAQKFYCPPDGNFYAQSADFRRSLIEKAMIGANGKVTAVAKSLGISHQNVSLLLKKYPDLCAKYNISARARKSGDSCAKKSAEELGFAVRLHSDRLSYLGLEEGQIVLFTRCPLHALDKTKLILLQTKDKNYHCGFLEIAFNMLALQDGRGGYELTTIDSEITDSGQVIGCYCDGIFIEI